MKTVKCLGVALALGVFGLTGCNKTVEGPTAPVINGVKVDFPKFQHAFEGASSDIQQSVSETIQGIRYGMYDKSMEALDKLNNDANVTADQKKAVTEID